jgi:hypothetical protein
MARSFESTVALGCVETFIDREAMKNNKEMLNKQ